MFDKDTVIISMSYLTLLWVIITIIFYNYGYAKGSRLTKLKLEKERITKQVEEKIKQREELYSVRALCDNCNTTNTIRITRGEEVPTVFCDTECCYCGVKGKIKPEKHRRPSKI